MKVPNRLGPLRQENVDELIDLHGAGDLVVYQVTVVLSEHLNETCTKSLRRVQIEHAPMHACTCMI